jgi:hypothetical protein
MDWLCSRNAWISSFDDETRTINSAQRELEKKLLSRREIKSRNVEAR